MEKLQNSEWRDILFQVNQAYISPLTPEVKVRENFKTRKSEYSIYKRVQK